MSDLVERARFLAAGQGDPHSATITELCDEIERLRARLRDAALSELAEIDGPLIGVID